MNGSAPHDTTRQPSNSRGFRGHCRYHLDIRRGRTRHRSRPIHASQFLVGSGAECHLQLGDAELAAVHCIVHAEPAGAWIEAVARVNRPVVNGIPVDSAPLSDGDEISIGAFDFVLRDFDAPLDDHEESPETSHSHAVAVPIDAGEPNLATLSAAELVDLLESDVQLVDDFENGVREGETVLHAALAARRHADELTELVTRLEGFADELDRRGDRLAERERQVEHAAAELEAMHHDLERRLANLESRSREGRPQPTRRAA